MKKNVLTLTKVIGCFFVIFGCQPTSSVDEAIGENKPETSGQLVDPSTPSDAQPLIFQESNKRTLAPPGTGWELEWSDEFGGSTLDSSKWTKTVSTKTRKPRPDLGVDDWWWKADHAFLDGNGYLTLRASKFDYNTMYCGSVDSKGKYEPTYGFFEVRLKIADTSKGNHTAFWFQGHNQGNVDGTGNDGAEIDVFESAWETNTTKSVIHIDGYGTDHQASTKGWNAEGIHSGYHTYGFNWMPGKLEIYYDGVKKTEYTDINWIPDVAEWLWLSVGASFADGDFVSQPTGILSNAKVDYVRVWKKDEYLDPTTDDFRIVNKKTAKWLKTYGVEDDSFIKQSNPSSTGDWTQWTIQETTGNYFYFVNTGSGKYFRPESSSDGAYLQLKPTSFGGSWTQWEMIQTNDGDGSVYLKNKETGKYIRPESSDDGDEIIQVSASNTDDWQKWLLVPVN